jgi:protein involved in polysaccharide export with SLBB domain
MSKSILLILQKTLCAALASAVFLPQSASAQIRVPEQRKTAINRQDSRAEREAELQVSLSPETILSILREEPGLLLQVKRVLVRKAFEQARILDPKDLTDEAVFRLVQEDENVRILATLEIEDRLYIRPKPTREELAQNRYREQAVSSGTAPQTGQSRNQEEAYWARHEDNFGPAPVYPLAAPTPAQQAPGNQIAPPVAPANPPSQSDMRRQLQRASQGSGNSDVFDTPQNDPGLLAKIQPEDLPALLNASSTQRYGPDGMTDGMKPGMNLGGAFPPGGSSNLPFGLYPSLGSQAPDTFSPPPQTARVDERWRPPLPPLPPQAADIDQPRLRHRPNPYADVPSLYDLYAQYSRSAVVERFGSEIFRNGTGNFDELPMDLPVGPDYVLGPGDGLNIDLWGAVSQRLRRVVDREGRVALPEAGAVQVAGRTLGDVQHLVQNALRSQFREVQADVSLSRLRTVRVYVVGDVQRPGAYDVSSLSTPLNALYTAGGPTARGSLRLLRHYRGTQLIQNVDIYDLLLHGVRSGIERLQAGDTILVPPIGPQVTIEGMVRRPSIYEMNGEKSLAEVLELAGGVLPSGTLRHVDVERLQAHESRSMLRVDLPENNNQQAVTAALEDFKIQDGDKIKISPILPYADKTVYLDGHVFRPGKFAYREGMKVTDLIKSYHDLLPEPSKRHAEIIRLNPPDYTPTVIAFNLGDALDGKEQNLVLKPFDTVRVFGRFDFEDTPVITVSGEVRDPGDHLTNGVTRLRDAVYLAGGVTPDAQIDDAQVFRRSSDGKLKVFSVNLEKALAGDEANNVLLEPRDRVFIHKNLAKVDPATVTIQGEVARPGKYPLGTDMSAAELVRLAGGLKRSAYTESADLTRYLVEDGKKVVGERVTVQIAKALAGEPDTDVRLQDGDVLSIGQLAGWKDMGATITLEGEVVHPGTYGIREGERLSSVIERAGGFRSDAYPYGVIFEREQVRDLEEKNRADLIRRVQAEGAELKLTPEPDPEMKLSKDAMMLQWQTALERLQNTPPSGRLVVHISKDTKKWANTAADVNVRAGDRVFIPKKPNFVVVTGSVYNPTAVTYRSSKNAGWYLSQAGGPTTMANKKAIFVIRADGSVISDRSGGWFSGGVDRAALQPGDMVVVPERSYSGSNKWKTTLQAAQLVYSVGVAIQVARSF